MATPGYLQQTGWLDQPSALYSHMQSKLRTWRSPLVLLGITLFAAGAYWSFRGMAISAGDIHPRFIAVLALFLIPSLLYGGVGFVLLARSSGLRVPLGRATVISIYAYLAEILPVPGGAIVRAGALVGAGGSAGRSTTLVLTTAILWIALAMIGAGLTILPSSLHLAWPLLLAGGVISASLTLWLWRISTAAIALQTLVHRILGILLTGVRLQFAFAALGTSVAFLDSMPFVLALLLGSASSIAPAGLGISESLAALVATTSSYPPGIAFLAVGLDRLICLAGCAILATAVQIVEYAKPALQDLFDRPKEK